MKLLSIVLPVYRVQGYLRQCLDSVLSQSFGDFEVIAVDDCSPDNSGAILAEYAARDPRVRVVTAPENVGLGGARNLGLQEAAGEYVWFVDSDDWLAQGALAAVAKRLRDTEPEVLVVGWDRVHWNGPVDAAAGKKTLAKAPKTFTVEQYPALLDVLHVAWNKVVRRDLLLKLGFAFQPGWYEDVSFTYPILLAADRISTLPRVCVHYRQRRTGAITRTVGDRHFEVFDHWEQAFALSGVYASPTPALQGLLFRRMIWHYLSVLRHNTRVPSVSRRRFFRRMTENYHLFLPPAGYPPPASRAERLRYGLVARGSYPAFRAMDLAVRALKGGKRAARRVVARGVIPVKRLRQAAYQAYYRVQLRLPIDDNLAVYAAYWFRGVSCNPAAIAGKAAELAPQVKSVWVVGRGREKTVPPGTGYVVAGTPAYYRAIARARYLINNVNWPNRLVKRPGTTHVMTHHGTPLKMMGMDQLDHPAGIRDQNFEAQMRRADRWDFSVTANAHTTIAWSGLIRAPTRRSRWAIRATTGWRRRLRVRLRPYAGSWGSKTVSGSCFMRRHTASGCRTAGRCSMWSSSPTPSGPTRCCWCARTTSESGQRRRERRRRAAGGSSTCPATRSSRICTWRQMSCSPTIRPRCSTMRSLIALWWSSSRIGRSIGN